MSAVLYRVRDGVAWLTLNEPDNRNALNARIINGIGGGLAAAVADVTVRAIVLSHVGSTFCAGADLKGGGPQEDARHTFPEILAAMQDSPKPVVAKLAGHCMGGGVGLAAAADLSIASADVMFGFTEVRIGVAPAMISVVCLPKLSKADAADLFLTGRKITAARAVEVGLINDAVAGDELDAKTDDLLQQLLAGGPKALAAAKSLLRDVPALSRDDAFEHTAALAGALFSSPEAAEGIAAFRERRAAAWIPSVSEG